MIQTIKNALKKTFVFDIYKAVCERKLLREWERKGRLVPPPHIYKEQTIKEYASRFRTRVMVETGTYLGVTVEAMKKTFERIFSIELDRELYEQARDKFALEKHITIVHGDSGEVMPEVLAQIEEPVLFWLDGHYSAGITAKGESDTPIVKELNHIFNHPVKDHVILIDDAREFTGKNDYPALEELQKHVKENRPHWVFEVMDDIIRAHPKSII